MKNAAFAWYLPSFHGDIKLERVDEDTTTVRAFSLTPIEEKAMTTLREAALATRITREPWAEAKDFPEPGSTPYRSQDGVTITLHASITTVQKVLTKALKPGRALVNAYVFSNGRLEEMRRSPEVALATSDPEKPKAAATVAAPTIGCPVPEFPEEEIRATRVLEAFLTPEQLRDYRAHGVIMARGADTGHTYAITHRGRKTAMRSVSCRSLFDMTERLPLCVHDWEVPPPEEMLSLLLCVSLPGREGYVRTLPEVYL